MRSIRARLVAVAAMAGALAVAAPVSASAQITPIGFPTGGPSLGCADVPIVGTAGQVAGDGGGSLQQACGAVLAFNGPAIGTVSSVVGPTIIGGPVLAPVTASISGANIVYGP